MSVSLNPNSALAYQTQPFFSQSVSAPTTSAVSLLQGQNNPSQSPGITYSPLLAEANKVTLQEIIALNLAMMKNDAMQGRPTDTFALTNMSDAIGPGFSVIA